LEVKMASPVIEDRQRTKMIMTYLIGVATLGVIGVIVTIFADFGFMGYLVSGILLLGGLGGLGGLRASGGAWTAACPNCGATMSSSEFGDEAKLREPKVVKCPRCGVYVRGTEALAVVEEGYIHDKPVFAAPLPERFQWPGGCQVCGGQVIRTVKAEGRSFAGSMGGVVGVGVTTVVSVDVPVCDAHLHEPVWLVRTSSGPVILFKAIEFWRRFRVKNELP